ncbi:MAG: nucleotidyltransferase domain-containing protein [Ignavibacteriales bacterium]
MGDDDVIEGIAQGYGISLVYIFGSQLQVGLEILRGIRRSRVDPVADIDIGVVLERGMPPARERIDLYSTIHNALQDVSASYPVDLVFLQETHSVFQANAICGQCIRSVNPEFKAEYEDNTLRRAADFRPFLEMYLDEILGGGERKPV